MIQFSVIIPTYNREKILCEIIDFVINQTYRQYEIIIIDDGSTDNTYEKIKNKIHSNNYINYYRQENSGVSSARNLGAKKSIGNYLIFLDSDDILIEDALMNFMNAIKNDEDIIHADLAKYIRGSDKLEIIKAQNPYGIGKGKGVYIPGAFCIKKYFFDKIGGYDEKIKFGENTELKFRIDIENPKRSFTNKPSIIYKDTPLGESKNLNNKINANNYILQKHQTYFIRYPKVKQLYYQNNAIAEMKLHRYKDAKKSIVHAWLSYQKNIKTFLRMLIIQIPFLAKKIWK